MSATPRTLPNLLIYLYRPLVRRAARQALQGRRVDTLRPEAGRFLRQDVTAFLDDVWRRVRSIVAEGDLITLPTIGNKNNVFLAAVTIAAYHALLDAGVEREYAMDLVADVGWKLYALMATAPLALARLVSKDPQHRVDLALQWLLRFPFSAPGRPGYEVQAWSDSGRFYTYWSFCAPLGFIRRYIQRHDDRGEIEAFYRSWCLYDWPLADILAGGKAGERNHYERTQTLSRGDAVCDMCFHAVAGEGASGPKARSHQRAGAGPLST